MQMRKRKRKKLRNSTNEFGEVNIHGERTGAPIDAGADYRIFLYQICCERQMVLQMDGKEGNFVNI